MTVKPEKKSGSTNAGEGSCKGYCSDDGSSDGTREILEEYARRDSRVTG
ncbi:MAG: hypothetical protein ACK53X_02895 [Holosporales bacterium]